MHSHLNGVPGILITLHRWNDDEAWVKKRWITVVRQDEQANRFQLVTWRQRKASFLNVMEENEKNSKNRQEEHRGNITLMALLACVYRVE